MLVENSNIFSEVKVEAKIIRANGTEINLGQVDQYSSNPFKRLAWELWGKRKLNKRIAEVNKQLQNEELGLDKSEPQVL